MKLTCLSTWTIYCLLCSVCITGVAPAQQELEGRLEAFLGKPGMDMQQVFQEERFPNVVVSLQGTVILTWGQQRVVTRRSMDGGKTFLPIQVIADPGFQAGGTLVDQTSGDILAFVEDHHPPASGRIFRSKDDGETWQAQSLTIQPDANGNIPSLHMNEHGITLRSGEHAGRLLRPTRWYAGKNDRTRWPHHYTNAIYSDDGGKTWQTSEPFPENGTGEAAVAELSDGRIYYNSRVHWQDRPRNTRRRAAWSRDGGQPGKTGRWWTPCPTDISIDRMVVWVD